MGAIASGGVQVLNPAAIELLGISDEVIREVAARERHELQRRGRAYREQRPPAEIRGRTVIVVDDGIATGSTMRAAVSSLRQLEAARIVVATPTTSWSAAKEIQPEVDDFVAVMTSRDFSGVGEWYEDFAQTSDAEVRELLRSANHTHPG